jgi:T-complex protein 1 subunit gamma
MAVVRNVLLDPKLVPGGGAVEMVVSRQLYEYANSLEGAQQWAVKGLAQAFEVIPRTLAQNCGCDVVRVVTELRAKHAEAGADAGFWGVDGMQGVVANMRELKVWDPLVVKKQTFKTAIESACMLLKIDEIVSGLSKKEKKQPSGGAPDETES